MRVLSSAVRAGVDRWAGSYVLLFGYVPRRMEDKAASALRSGWPAWLTCLAVCWSGRVLAAVRRFVVSTHKEWGRPSERRDCSTV